MKQAQITQLSESQRLTLTLGVLCAVTLVTWWLGHETAGHSAVIGLSVLAIAFVKVLLIISEFMEVRTAPRWLRLFTTGWLAAVAAVSVSLFLI